MEQNNGSKLLKVMSIIMIIGGILGAIASAMIVLVAALGTAVINDAEVQKAAADAGVKTNAVMALLWVAAAFGVVGAVIEIIAGVKGKKNFNNPSAAPTLLKFGIACCALSVISEIVSLIGGGDFSVTSLLFGLVIPVLYIVGVVQLKNQAQ